MRIKSFSVERYRNVLASGDVPVDPTVTCLVGKNESGKTNLLHALETLNPARRNKTFHRLDYPTWLAKRHQRTGEFDEAQPITAVFELSDDDRSALADRFGSGVLTGSTLTVGMGYDNHLYFTVEVSEKAAAHELGKQSEINIGAETIPAAVAELTKVASLTREDADGNEVPTDNAVKARRTLERIAELYDDGDVEAAVGDFLAQRMPRFFYFDEYAELAGRTRIEALVETIKSGDDSGLDDRQRTALSLLRLGFANEELLDPDYEIRSGEMQTVAADLTQRVREYWRQNEYLRLRIDIEPVAAQQPDGEHIVERYLQLRVLDDRHQHDNSLDARSSGFRWFVSFLAAFSEFEEEEDVIVLLDEPALALHARAQADFLRFIEETLATTHQVLYTTHSPFMVDASRLDRVRVVEDTGPEVGAIVRTQLMSRDPDTLSPLQGALGYDIAQNIFVGPDNLVVEGLSDYTYLTVLSEVLREAGRPHLDQRWRVLPAGGAGTMPAAISLLGRDLDVTVVVDGGSKPPQKLNNLVNEGILDDTRIIMLGEAAGLDAADIEDLFHIDDYLALYNAALGANLAAVDLADGDRIVARIERSIGSYNHNDPSNWLLANRAQAVPRFRGETLDRFERVVVAINSTLAAARA